MAERFHTLITVRRLAVYGTALLALCVVVGGVRLGSNGYARWVPETENPSPLAGIVAGFIDGPRIGQLTTGATTGVGVASPAVDDEMPRQEPTPTPVSTPAADSVPAVAPEQAFGAIGASPAIETVFVPPAPTALDEPYVEVVPAEPGLPGPPRFQGGPPGRSWPGKSLSRFGVEKIDSSADTSFMEGGAAND